MNALLFSVLVPGYYWPLVGLTIMTSVASATAREYERQVEWYTGRVAKKGR